MKFSVILGTRPEIIKLSSLIRELERKKADYFIIHSNQHYSKEMDEVFFDELELPKPKYNLNIGSGNHGEMTGRMMIAMEKILIDEKPDCVFVQGDTNTVLAGALAASKLGVKIAHIEAGLRSYDKSMPEEINRVITDHISDYLFAPTKLAADILEREGIGKNKIFKVGNTIVDAVFQNSEIAARKVNKLDTLKINKDEYFLLTMHRPSNVDSQANISSIFQALEKVYEKYNLPIIFPIHPRTKKQIESFNLSLPKGITEIPPIGFLEMLQLEAEARLIITDSGGIQEEACILKVPSVTLRFNTERPEAIEVGASVLAGNSCSKIITSIDLMLNKSRNWKNPFGDGESANKILYHCENIVG